jgi:hypothetical protein
MKGANFNFPAFTNNFSSFTNMRDGLLPEGFIFEIPKFI